MAAVPRIRRHRSAVLIAITAAVLAFPLGVLASHQFSDVPNSNPYHADISALADSGVTTGCGGGKFCPGDYVTREQMAAFMNRLGALGVGKTPVANAATSRSTDGWSIGCPSNTVLSGGLCFDTATRSSGSIFDASEACANLGGGIFGAGQIWRLPAVLELRAALVNGDIAVPATEWSSTTWYDDANGFRGMALGSDEGMVDSGTITSRPYRCAAIPLTIDPLILIPLNAPKDGSDPGKIDPDSHGKTNEDGSRK